MQGGEAQLCGKQGRFVILKQLPARHTMEGGLPSYTRGSCARDCARGRSGRGWSCQGALIREGGGGEAMRLLLSRRWIQEWTQSN